MIWNLPTIRKLPFRPDGVSHQTMCSPKELIELRLFMLSKDFDQIVNAPHRHGDFFKALTLKNNLFAQYFAM